MMMLSLLVRSARLFTIIFFVHSDAFFLMENLRYGNINPRVAPKAPSAKHDENPSTTMSKSSEQWKKTWLFRFYRGLHYPTYGDFYKPSSIMESRKVFFVTQVSILQKRNFHLKVPSIQLFQVILACTGICDFVTFVVRDVFNFSAS